MKTVVITGGSQGLGEGIARALVNDHNVVILSNEKEQLARVSEELQCDGVYCDVRDADACKEVIDGIVLKHGSIDALVNNAGVYARCSMEEHSTGAIDAVIDVNVKGPIYLTKAAIPHMKKQQDGVVLNVVSQVALQRRAGTPVYDASKAALHGYGRAMQEELREFGIRIMGLYPGRIETALAENSGMARNMNASLSVEDVAKTVAFMLSFDAPVTFSEVGIKHINY